MNLTTDDLISALRLRYDHYSARTLFEAARDRAGLADRAAYEPREVATWRTALASLGDRLDNVWIRLDALLETAPAVEAKPVEAKKPVVEMKTEMKTEAKPPVTEEKPPVIEATPTEVIETMIAVAGVELQEGEQVLICGGLGELGDWDPARARLMSRDGDLWLTTLVIPTAAQVAFKFLRRGADGNVEWERGENRDLVAKPRIDAVWR